MISGYHYIVFLFYIKNNPEHTIRYFNFGYILTLFEGFLLISLASAIKIFKYWYQTHHKKVLLEKQGLISE